MHHVLCYTHCNCSLLGHVTVTCLHYLMLLQGLYGYNNCVVWLFYDTRSSSFFGNFIGQWRVWKGKWCAVKSEGKFRFILSEQAGMYVCLRTYIWWGHCTPLWQTRAHASLRISTLNTHPNTCTAVMHNTYCVLYWLYSTTSPWSWRTTCIYTVREGMYHCIIVASLLFRWVTDGKNTEQWHLVSASVWLVVLHMIHQLCI